MKNRTRYHRCPAYPNAADERYFLDKIINAVTAIVSGVGFITAMLFLTVLF